MFTVVVSEVVDISGSSRIQALNWRNWHLGSQAFGRNKAIQ
jgi:hypothetical protein